MLCHWRTRCNYHLVVILQDLSNVGNALQYYTVRPPVVSLWICESRTIRLDPWPPPPPHETSQMSVGWLCWGLTSQSTIFQSCRDGAIASWVINQYFRGVKCLAQGHNTAAVGLEPWTSRSGVRHSTTEPPRSPQMSVHVSYLDGKNEILLWFMNYLHWQNMSWP